MDIVQRLTQAHARTCVSTYADLRFLCWPDIFIRTSCVQYEQSSVVNAVLGDTVGSTLLAEPLAVQVAVGISDLPNELLATIFRGT